VARGQTAIDSATVANAAVHMRDILTLAAPLLEQFALGAGLAFPPADSGGSWGARVDPRMPAALKAGEHVRVEVLCINEGSRTWTPNRLEGPHLAVSYHVKDRNGGALVWDGERTLLTALVPPGSEVRLQANFTAPPVAGDYFVEWDMVCESECWFHDAGSQTTTVALRVTWPDEQASGRYPVAVVPVSAWSPRFGKMPAESASR
jgi:hypothetical protein